MGLEIRPATPDDAAAIQAIYAHYCLNGHATFEEEAPSVAQMAARVDAVVSKGLPWVVAELDGVVRAYAYAGLFRERTAYRFTAEDTVYVDANFCGRGLGRATLDAVIEACTAKGLHRLLAVIGGSFNRMGYGRRRPPRGSRPPPRSPG